MRWIHVVLLPSLLLVLASPAFAALAKYEVRARTIAEFDTQSPILAIRSSGGLGRAVIDNQSTPGNPILKRLVHVIGPSGGTVNAPGVSGFIFLKTQTKEGPAQPQTGTGSVANSIAWGDVTSWTITGGQFCNAVPTFICGAAMRIDDDTVSPELLSTHYPFGAWNFHGTGYKSDPWVFFTNRVGGFGNAQYVYFGPTAQDGTVPALPLLGVGAAGLSLVAVGLTAVRRTRR